MLLKKALLPVIILCFSLIRCKEEKKSQPSESPQVSHQEVTDTVVEEKSRDTCDLEKQLIAYGLVDIQQVIPGILVDLRYSDTANFLHADVYGELENVYLQPDVAEKLKLAQHYLKEKDSTLTLLVFDGVRPRSVQQKMWDIVDIPLAERGKFVSNPKKGSLHNYGAAVDITLARNNGEELDMGTPFDDPSPLAYPTMEKQFLESGELLPGQVKNRQLLRAVLIKAGFFNIQTEWWHFNSCYREEAQMKYDLVE